MGIEVECGAYAETEHKLLHVRKIKTTRKQRYIREIYIRLWGARCFWPCSYGSNLHKTRKTSFFL